jgi:hypothetical protein
LALAVVTLATPALSQSLREGCGLLSIQSRVLTDKQTASTTLCGRWLQGYYPYETYAPTDWIRCAANVAAKNINETHDDGRFESLVKNQCQYLLEAQENYFSDLISSCGDVLALLRGKKVQYDSGSFCRAEVMPLQPMNTGDPEDFVIFGAQNIVSADGPVVDLHEVVRPSAYKSNVHAD